MALTSLILQCESYLSEGYCCQACGHQTTIYIHSDYSMFNLMEVDKLCSCCGFVRNELSDGDLILRFDWPNPDNPPWQLQCASMKDKDRYCWDCKDKIKEDWRKLTIACSQCEGTMEYFECFTCVLPLKAKTLTD